jgi:glycosyltransferase involved in cell wall biosynthesis
LSLGYSQPFFLPCKSVVTIHDLNWYYHPEDFDIVTGKIWEVITRLSAKFATHVITDSRASRKSLIAVLNLKTEKITAILHGTPTKVVMSRFDRATRLKSLGIHKPYIFTVLSSAPHKNLITLLKSFKSIEDSNKSLSLVVVGLGSKSLAKDSRIKNLGYVTRQDLVALYQESSVFVFPSAYEGFGYPVLEAMQYGVPVISSDAFSLKEVVSKYGLLNPPYEVNGYTKKIKLVLSDKVLYNKLVQEGKTRSNMLSWTITARKTLKIITKLNQQYG